MIASSLAGGRARWQAASGAAMFVAISIGGGCRTNEAPSAPAGSSAAATAASAPDVAGSQAPSAAATKTPLAREGGSLARSARGDALYVADDPRSAIRVVSLPLGENIKDAPSVALPGRPGQIVATADLVLATIRDPGLLLLLRPDAAKGLVEVGRVTLPPDAWGVAVAPDGKTAVVTSAWTHKVSVVDLATKSVKASVDVEREPRGIAIRADGQAAYVSHLVGAALTRVPLDGSAPTRVDLAAAPLRAPFGTKVEASNGWALALSPDGKRLYAGRHALGAPFEAAWFGAASVDVLLTAKDTPIVAARAVKPIVKSALPKPPEDATLERQPIRLAEPRAIVYRAKTKTLLVLSEGHGALCELDASAIDPSVDTLERWPISDTPDPTEPAPTVCAGPTGLALASDEETAFVWCPGSGDLATVDLDAFGARAKAGVRVTHLADDPLPKLAARGRRVFHDASDTVTSGGLACAGCHPEGRDDGHVWMEVEGPMTKAPIFVASASILKNGYARQTPMLAGRVAAEGPYGWHAQNDDLGARAIEGMHLHRWLAPSRPWAELEKATQQRAEALAAFLRTGLVPPVKDAHALTPEEARGKEIFTSQEAGCAGCHVPETEYTNRTAVPLPKRAPPAGFADDPNPGFKTPSLSFVGGTAPYYPDGSETTLEDLVSHNEDRMGKTKQLSEQDRAALVAFLRSL